MLEALFGVFAPIIELAAYIAIAALVIMFITSLGATTLEPGASVPAPAPIIQQAPPAQMAPAPQAAPQPAAYDLPPDVSNHAYERHGDDATTAINFVKMLDPNTQKCKWDCPDGRTRYVCLDPSTRRWSVVVEEMGRIVTAFWTKDGAYANRTVSGCMLNLR